MALIGPPPSVAVDNSGDSVSQSWAVFFSNVSQILNALTSNGQTATRPTKMLWAGRTYFDSSLGKPIWYNGATWVDATGAGV